MSDAPSRRPPGRRRATEAPSQLVELFLSVAGALGYTSDREVAELAGTTPENVSNWRRGLVREFKLGTLRAIEAALVSELRRRGVAADGPDRDDDGLGSLAVEEGSSPADLQRQFRDRVQYDYLGHRFLYYEPMGALAWENLIKRGYEQDCWLEGVERCADAWTDSGRGPRGPLAEALGWGRGRHRRGLDVVSLGPGEGSKERAILARLLARAERDGRLPWLAYAPVDVSIPLLLTAARQARLAFAESGSGARRPFHVLPFSADFEEGRLAFVRRLPSADTEGGLRLVLVLGNVFGNLRDEDSFVRQRLSSLVRPGDRLWLEVGVRMEPIDADPLFRMTESDRAPTAAETHRNLLLEGPYRRWEAAMGRRPAELSVRLWLREGDDTARVPGSVNFCHDLVIHEERRVCTMLYSRRYRLEPLVAWLEERGFELERLERVEDSTARARVAHLLLRRRAAP